MNEPLVSVIIATYRREKELKRALESLVAQSYLSFEIVLVDDNSDSEWNDKVKELVTNFIDINTNIQLRYIENKENLGSAQTRNVGIKACQGEYVCFLDDDDVYLPDKIKNQITAMIAAEADYSITDLALYDEREKLIEVRKRDYIIDESQKSLLRYHLMYHITGTDVIMFRKDYLFKIGCFPPINVGDEFYLMQRAIEGGGKFLYLPICDVKAYVHTGEGGLSSGSSKINGENQLFEYKKKYFNQLREKDVKYIKMRHHAVLAYAYLRSKKILCFGIESIKSFFSAPKDLIALVKSNKNM